MLTVTVRNPFLALSAALSLAACTLQTKLAELSEGDGSSDPSAGTSGEPTTGGSNDSTPINSGGTNGESGGATVGESGESGGASTDTGECPPSTATLTPLRPNVVLVLDKSGSMVGGPDGLWDHDSNPNTVPVTRWFSLHTVVDSVLTDFGDVIDFGAHLFPGPTATADYNAGACQIDATISVAVAQDNRAAILAAIPGAGDDTLRGGTPVAAGVSTAIDHLKTLDAEVPRAIVLVTDGAANCASGEAPPELFEAYDDSVHTVVADAFTVDGIPTYVVGIGIVDAASPVQIDGTPDGINSFDKLNALAEDGGKPRDDPDQKFHSAGDQTELAAALTEIAADVTSCVVPIGQAVLTPEETTVEIDGAPVAKVSDCASEDGWVYTTANAPFDTIELCGAACTALQAFGSVELTACVPE